MPRPRCCQAASYLLRLGRYARGREAPAASGSGNLPAWAHDDPLTLFAAAARAAPGAPTAAGPGEHRQSGTGGAGLHVASVDYMRRWRVVKERHRRQPRDGHGLSSRQRVPSPCKQAVPGSVESATPDSVCGDAIGMVF